MKGFEHTTVKELQQIGCQVIEDNPAHLKQVQTSQTRDSQEEDLFAFWVEEALQHHILIDPEYQPPSFSLSDRVAVNVEKQLKTKTKTVEKFLLHPHVYTADWSFTLLLPIQSLFPKVGTCWIDVKGTWQNRGATQEFSINQKWVYEKHGVYINKVVPDKFFQQTWCPRKALLTPKQLKVRKKFAACRIVEDFLQTWNN